MNKRAIGKKYEELAVNELLKKEYTILEKNYQCLLGEIDIIALDRSTLVFFEVKYRKSIEAGYPEEAVSAYKQRRICKTADYYCMENHINDDNDFRFDVIAIDNSGVRHYENAFIYSGSWKR